MVMQRPQKHAQPEQLKAGNVCLIPPNRLKFELTDNICFVRQTENPNGCKAVPSMKQN